MVLNSLNINRLKIGILLLISLNFGCQKKNSSIPSVQTLRLNIRSEPVSLDPRLASDVTSSNITKLCFEGLMRLDKEGKAVPAVVERYESSEDKRSYRFYLKESSWSDGQKVTAEDFAYSWKSILDPRFACPFSSDLYVIKNGRAVKESSAPMESLGIKVLDTLVLEIELEYPTPYFLKLLATRSFLPIPSHVARKFPNWARDAGNNYICNGPFLLSEWKHHNQLLLTKNPTYWNATTVKLEHLKMPIVEDENTELSMFNNGELDWAGFPFSSLPVDAMEFLKDNKLSHFFPIAGTYFYIFNTQRYPLNNVNLRKALTLAINRKEIVENITKGHQLPALALVPPELMPREQSYFEDGDILEARSLFAQALKELGTSIENFPEISLTYNTLQAHHQIAQAIQQQWHRAFGIRVRLENKEWKVYLDEVHKGNFYIARMGAIASIDDPLAFLENYCYDDRLMNYAGWNNTQFRKVIFNAMRQSDPLIRMAELKEAEGIIMEDMPIAPIYFYSGSYLKKPYVKDVRLTAWSEFDCSSAYIEKK